MVTFILVVAFIFTDGFLNHVFFGLLCGWVARNTIISLSGDKVAR